MSDWGTDWVNEWVTEDLGGSEGGRVGGWPNEWASGRCIYIWVYLSEHQYTTGPNIILGKLVSKGLSEKLEIKLHLFQWIKGSFTWCVRSVFRQDQYPKSVSIDTTTSVFTNSRDRGQFTTVITSTNVKVTVQGTVAWRSE